MRQRWVLLVGAMFGLFIPNNMFRRILRCFRLSLRDWSKISCGWCIDVSSQEPCWL